MKDISSIWIDLANSPHVPFFMPIISHLNERNCTIYVTIRDFSQTVQLAKEQKLDGPVIGGHGGKSKLGKISNIIDRSLQLRKYARDKSIHVAVSHNSYTQIIAARALGIRAVTLMDYEGQKANHLAFRLAHKLIVPMHFPDSYLKMYGANFRTTHKYEGFKEQLYLSNFSPDPSFLETMKPICSLPDSWELKDNFLITVRPPAYMAFYHQFENPLFNYLIEKLSLNSDITVVMIPRTPGQKEEMQKKYPMFHYPSAALDGNNLVYYSDLVISAGGTMNREAAVLGTPVYTIFAGELPAVDRKLIEMERLQEIGDEHFIDTMKFKKSTKNPILKNEQLLHDIIDHILH